MTNDEMREEFVESAGEHIRISLGELQDNADRYEFLRERKIVELMERNALPVGIEDAEDWFDKMIDKQIQETYPNGVMERMVKK